MECNNHLKNKLDTTVSSNCLSFNFLFLKTTNTNLLEMFVEFTVLLTSFGAPKDKILVYMLVSAIVWSIVLCGIVYTLGTAVLPDFMK